MEKVEGYHDRQFTRALCVGQLIKQIQCKVVQLHGFQIVRNLQIDLDVHFDCLLWVQRRSGWLDRQGLALTKELDILDRRALENELLHTLLLCVLVPNKQFHTADNLLTLKCQSPYTPHFDINILINHRFFALNK